MGSCILTFDQMQILTKKSDSRHSDNDWLIVTWFVGPDNVRTDTVPLRNQAGDVVLSSGDTIQPVPLLPPVSCADGDLVTATFQVVNLGSTDFSDQEQAAADIGKKIAETVAEVYVTAAEEVVRAGVPAGEVFAYGIEQLKPVIVSSVGAAWDDIIVPLVDDVIGLLQQLAGVPNCNGDVLHDIIVFMPFEPKDPLTWTKTYVASSKSGCQAASTSVVFTCDRFLDHPIQLSNTPAPDIEITPVHDSSPADWVGRWAPDPQAPVSIVFVDIEPSRPHSGSLRVTITERIDPRFGAEFDGGGDALFPQSHTVLRWFGNVTASVRPMFHPTMNPGDLALRLGARPTPHHPSHAPPGGGAPTEELSFGLTWQRPVVTSPRVPVTATLLSPGILAIPSLGPGEKGPFETVDTIAIPAQGVLLCLYAVKLKQDERTIGHMLRYIRSENMLYTDADWMLVPWTAFG